MLKVNRRSARVRICGESGELTFKSEDIWDIVPGQIVTLLIGKRWTWKGDDYGSGLIEDPRIEIDKLGLVAPWLPCVPPLTPRQRRLRASRGAGGAQQQSP